MAERLTKDQIHKKVIEVAALSKAKKRKVGALIAKVYGGIGNETYEVMATGFNWNPENNGVCEDENGQTYPSVVHAEIDCLTTFNLLSDIDQSAAYQMFITYPPCEKCNDAIANSVMSYTVVDSFMKFDKAKPRLALVPTSLVEGVAKVLTYGAKKYKTNNWRNTPDIECYISALERHMIAWKNGEEYDPESGLGHLEHAACNIAFLIELRNLPKIKEV